MATVYILEDNAGGVYLYAADGAMIYQGAIDALADEVACVADHPDGDANWSAELQTPADSEVLNALTTIAVWCDGALEVERSSWGEPVAGIAGREYLGVVRKPGRPRIHHEPRQDVRVSLPVDLITALDAAAGPGQRTAFVERAIRAALNSGDGVPNVAHH